MPPVDSASASSWAPARMVATAWPLCPFDFTAALRLVFFVATMRGSLADPRRRVIGLGRGASASLR
ncbi:MAG: hypothetical protein NVSMB47_02090 [Polyangiales bacterium]